MDATSRFAALARQGLPFYEYAGEFCKLAAATAWDDATLNKLFWLGANHHHPMDLPDTTGLSWREGVFRCLGSVRARARTSPPSFVAPASPPPFAAHSLPPFAAHARPPPFAAHSLPPFAAHASPPPFAAHSLPPFAAHANPPPFVAHSLPPFAAHASPPPSAALPHTCMRTTNSHYTTTDPLTNNHCIN